MAINESIVQNYNSAIKLCQQQAQSIGTIPQCGGYSTAGLEKNPAGLASVARAALIGGKAKVDAHKNQCINDSVGNFQRNQLHQLGQQQNQIAQNADQQGLPRPPLQSVFSFQVVFSPPINIPELAFLEQIANYCQRKHSYLATLEATIEKWESWTQEISEYYTTKIVKDAGSSMISVDRHVRSGGKNQGRSVKRDYLAAYFTEIGKTQLYSNNNETSKAVESKKNELSGAAAACVRQVVDSAKGNNFCGATNQVHNRSQQFEATRSSAERLFNELNEYIRSASSCANQTGNYNIYTGSWGLG